MYSIIFPLHVVDSNNLSVWQADMREEVVIDGLECVGHYYRVKIQYLVHTKHPNE
jgi:hypothetical protein